MKELIESLEKTEEVAKAMGDDVTALLVRVILSNVIGSCNMPESVRIHALKAVADTCCVVSKAMLEALKEAKAKADIPFPMRISTPSVN